MTTMFHDMMHKEVEVYVDDILIKSWKIDDHLEVLKWYFERLRVYQLKINPKKCVFWVTSGSFWDLWYVNKVLKWTQKR